MAKKKNKKRPGLHAALTANRRPPRNRPDNQPADRPGGGGGSSDPGAATTVPYYGTGDTVTQPPFGSYDPAIEAERRAVWRGLGDVKDDTARNELRAGQDVRQAREDIKTDFQRGRRDTVTSARRGRQKLGFERQDIARKSERGQQDLGFKLAELQRNFTRQGQEQGQTANAQGVADAGTMAASAERRATNLANARAPIDLAGQRLSQDTLRAQNRVDIAGNQLTQDTRRGLGELRQDRNRDYFLTKRDYRRDLHDYFTDEQRAIREATFTNADLLASEAYQARANHPGAFNKYGVPSAGGGPDAGRPPDVNEPPKPQMGLGSGVRPRRRRTRFGTGRRY